MRDEAEFVEMTGDAISGGEDDPRLLAAVKEYLSLLEKGQVSRGEFLARHADIADTLNNYLESLEMIHDEALKVRHEGILLSEAAGPPTTLGDFRILREIGRGGMGVVYEAVHVPLSRRVALKVLPLVSSLDPLRLQRFKVEAQAAARLQHPNIVQVYSVGRFGDLHYYAMQLIEGFSLAAVIEHFRNAFRESSDSRPQGDDRTKSVQHFDETDYSNRTRAREVAHKSTDRGGPTRDDGIRFRPADLAPALNSSLIIDSYSQPDSYFRCVAELVRQTALALEHAHQCGIVHRDIKPANLLVDKHDHVWVTDFGLARISTDAQLTRTGTPLGTLRYMSPEQAAGNTGLVDQRADVYALGVTFYELLTLEPAIPGDESHALLRRVIEEEPRRPRAVNNRIPVELETIILKSIAKSRDDRYLSAQALADDLQRWLNDEPIQARPPTLWERAAKWRRRHRVFVRAASLFSLLAVAGLLVAFVVIASAYQREAKSRREAEASFQQAREAVDAFSELAETELAAKPELRDVRRRMLETSLGYYREFQKQHSDDRGMVADIAKSSERMARIVDELKALEGSAPLLLMSDVRVQRDLQLSSVQKERINELLEEFRSDRLRTENIPDQGVRGAQRRLAALLRKHEQSLSAALSDAQSDRLQQIARQQRAPFIFRSPEVIAALQLTADQSAIVNTIIEEERIGGGGRQTLAPPSAEEFDRHGTDTTRRRRPGDRPPDLAAPDGDAGTRRRPPRPDGPPSRDDVDALIDEFYGLDTPPDRPPGPPPDDGDEGPPPGPPPRDGAHRMDIPPPRVHFDSARDGRDRSSYTDSAARATARILAILTDDQRAAWDKLTGPPCGLNLNWGPDQLLPR